MTALPASTAVDGTRADSVGSVDRVRLAEAVESMPPFPPALLRTRRALDEAETTTEDLASSVAMDARLTVAVMRLANSARYGVSDRRFSLAQSIARIGRAELRALVDALSLQRLFGGAVGAFCARHWSAYLPDRATDGHEAFSVALFRDLGRIVTDAALAEAGVAGTLYTQPQQRLAAERALLGYTHAGLSAALVAHWGFDEAVARAIGSHHDAPLTGSGALLALVAQLGDRAAVAVAGAARAPGEGEEEEEEGVDPFLDLQPSLAALLSDPRAAWDAIVAAAAEDLGAYSALFAA